MFPAGRDAYLYNSTTQQTFMLNISYQGFAAAEQSCKDSGGHLASYTDEAEQAEVRCLGCSGTAADPHEGLAWIAWHPCCHNVPALGRHDLPWPRSLSIIFALPCCSLQVEAYFVARGHLFPHFHNFYWMGLNASEWPIQEGKPDFGWLDKSPGPSNTTYEHWGL